MESLPCSAVLMSSHLNRGRACPGGRPCRSRYPRPSWTRRRRRTSTPHSSAPTSSPPAASAACAGTVTPPAASKKRYSTHCLPHAEKLALLPLLTCLPTIHSMPFPLERLVRRAGSLSAWSSDMLVRWWRVRGNWLVSRWVTPLGGWVGVGSGWFASFVRQTWREMVAFVEIVNETGVLTSTMMTGCCSRGLQGSGTDMSESILGLNVAQLRCLAKFD